MPTHVRSSTRAAEISPAIARSRACSRTLRFRPARPRVSAMWPAQARVRSPPPGVSATCSRSHRLQPVARPAMPACSPTRCRPARPEAVTAEPVEARVCSPSPSVEAACWSAQWTPSAAAASSLLTAVAATRRWTPLLPIAAKESARASSSRHRDSRPTRSERSGSSSPPTSPTTPSGCTNRSASIGGSEWRAPPYCRPLGTPRPIG